MTGPVDWAALKAEYVVGSMSLSDLARKYGIKPATVGKRAERGGWTAERRELSESVAAEAASRVVQTRASAITALNERDLAMAMALRAKAAKRLGRVTNDPATPDANLKALTAIASIAEAAQRMARLALGLPTTNTGLGRMGGHFEADPDAPPAMTFADLYAAQGGSEHDPNH